MIAARNNIQLLVLVLLVLHVHQLHGWRVEAWRWLWRVEHRVAVVVFVELVSAIRLSASICLRLLGPIAVGKGRLQMVGARLPDESRALKEIVATQILDLLQFARGQPD